MGTRGVMMSHDLTHKTQIINVKSSCGNCLGFELFRLLSGPNKTIRDVFVP